MPLLLPTILSNSTRPYNQFLLLQSFISHSCLPVVRHVLNQSQKNRKGSVLLVCFLYPPSCLINGVDPNPSTEFRIINRTGKVPGYDDEYSDPREEILNGVKAAPAGAVEVIIDSVDTLCADLDSVSATYTFLSDLLLLIRARPAPSRLIVHLATPPATLLALLTQTRFSPTLVHVRAHPPVLLTHLATAYLTPPPPLAPPEKFWRVFIPVAERRREVEELVFGADGEGVGAGVEGETVLEVLVRGGGEGVGAGRRRGVERVLEGWSRVGPCELSALESLKGLWTRKVVHEHAPDPTTHHSVSFNLDLTPEQQQSRAQVPLPYAHEGKPSASPAAIFYDPDSADDMDDEDPDEDLDI